MSEQEVAEQPGKEIAPWKDALIGARERFVAIASSDNIVEWQRESMFALQALEKSDFLRQVANNNPSSLRNAIINVAGCGITLNPAAQYAALVPRDGAVCLDIMFRGLIKIATDAGSIRWVQAELVYATDKFTFRGRTAAPIHEADVFSKSRGDVVGVYCVAKTVDGDVLTETMTIDDVNAIRDRSQYWMKKKAGPWKTDPGEMAKKTVIKRARKTWPESQSKQQAERLQVATELANLADGYVGGFESDAIVPSAGAMEALSQDERSHLTSIATEIIKRSPQDANEYMDSQGLDPESQVALWTLLDSKTRSAMKKAREQEKVDKKLDALSVRQ